MRGRWPPVFEHNRLDLLTLAALTARALHLVRVGPEQAADPREALALGWIYARAGLDALGRQAYERAIDLCSRDARWRRVGFVRSDPCRSAPFARADAPPFACVQTRRPAAGGRSSTSGRCPRHDRS